MVTGRFIRAIESMFLVRLFASPLVFPFAFPPFTGLSGFFSSSPKLGGVVGA
jgi:hypothetical protein